MFSQPALEKAEIFDLTYEQVIILFHIAAWFNGHPAEVRGNEVSIGSGLEPTLPQLCGNEWTRRFHEHHQQLVQRGLLREDTGDGSVYVAGNRCEWLPTRDGMQVIEHLFSHRDDVYPEWFHDHLTRPPTFRDGEELLEHRKGTMVAKYTFLQNTWYVTKVGVYPRFRNSPDLHLFRKHKLLAYVEVQTDHHNAESRTRKFNHWTEDENVPAVIWIFPNRTVMIETWNRLVADGHITLKGGMFDKPADNWPPQRVNDRLRYSGLDHCCLTIGGMLRAGEAAVSEFLHKNCILMDL